MSKERGGDKQSQITPMNGREEDAQWRSMRTNRIRITTPIKILKCDGGFGRV
jgi:hypothetical protein